MVNKKRLSLFMLLVTISIIVASLALACTSARPQPNPASPPPAKSAARTFTISDDTAIQLITKLIGDTNVHFLPGNKAQIRYAVSDVTISLEAIDGALCISGMEPVLYRYGTDRVANYLKKRPDGKISLVALWFDPRKELKAESDQLPFIESVTTEEYKATFTYRPR